MLMSSVPTVRAFKRTEVTSNQHRLSDDEWNQSEGVKQIDPEVETVARPNRRQVGSALSDFERTHESPSPIRKTPVAARTRRRRVVIGEASEVDSFCGMLVVSVQSVVATTRLPPREIIDRRIEGCAHGSREGTRGIDCRSRFVAPTRGPSLTSPVRVLATHPRVARLVQTETGSSRRNTNTSIKSGIGRNAVEHADP